MPADFESGIGTSQAWHGGLKIHSDGKLTSKIALEESGLDWLVLVEPVMRNGYEVDGKFFTVRSIDDQVLGIVGRIYEPVQNYEGFKMIDALVDSDEVEIETAISLRGGKTVAIVAKRPEHVLIGGEKYMPYLVFSNSHDGSSMLQMVTTTVRVVCTNTLALALKGARNKYKIRHTRAAQFRIQEARQALEMTFAPDSKQEQESRTKDAKNALSVARHYATRMQNVGEELLVKKISTQGFERFVRNLVPLPENGKAEGRGFTMRRNTQDAILGIYYQESNLNDIRGTEWGALQAVVQYNDHERNYRSTDSRFENLVGGSDLNQQAYKLLVN